MLGDIWELFIRTSILLSGYACIIISSAEDEKWIILILASMMGLVRIFYSIDIWDICVFKNYSKKQYVIICMLEVVTEVMLVVTASTSVYRLFILSLLTSVIRFTYLCLIKKVNRVHIIVSNICQRIGMLK